MTKEEAVLFFNEYGNYDKMYNENTKENIKAVPSKYMSDDQIRTANNLVKCGTWRKMKRENRSYYIIGKY